MSRTHAHLPTRVIHERFGIIEHDHINGECDYDHNDPTNHNRRSSFRTQQSHVKKCKKLQKYSVICYHFKAKQRLVHHSFDPTQEYVNDPQLDYGHSNTVLVRNLSNDETLNSADFHNFLFCHKDFDKKFYRSRENGYNKKLLRFDNDSGFIEDGKNFVYHTYTMTIRNESLACECDVKKSKIDRIASHCEKVADREVVLKHKSKSANQCRDCDYCKSHERATTNRTRMTLNKIASMFNNGESVEEIDMDL